MKRNTKLCIVWNFVHLFISEVSCFSPSMKNEVPGVSPLTLQVKVCILLRIVKWSNWPVTNDTNFAPIHACKISHLCINESATVGWVCFNNETLTNVTRYRLDLLVVQDSGSALVELSSIFPIPLPWKSCISPPFFPSDNLRVPATEATRFDVKRWRPGPVRNGRTLRTTCWLPLRKITYRSSQRLQPCIWWNVRVQGNLARTCPVTVRCSGWWSHWWLFYWTVYDMCRLRKGRYVCCGKFFLRQYRGLSWFWSWAWIPSHPLTGQPKNSNAWCPPICNIDPNQQNM